jgi:molybdopterin molybdotransferase
MISVSDGQARILAQITTVAPPELIPVGHGLGRVTAEDIRSSMDVPPTDNSAVDGYAVRSADIPASGSRDLDVIAELAAGAVFHDVLRPGQALRIMTGAPMPPGADTVYPQEIVSRQD